MNQMLHIFKKDVRRHYPEILISLVLLAMYTRYSLPQSRGLTIPDYVSDFAYLFAWRFIVLALILFWGFFIVRLIQGDSLVGDRQWWITKPCVWWELLLAKLFFLFVFISIPLFFVQLLILHDFGFAVLTNLPGVFHMQFSFALLFFTVCLVLGSLTRNLSQCLIAIICALIAFSGLNSLTSRLPSGQMSSVVAAADTLQSFVFGFAALAAIVWQFARRRTWYTRGTALASFAGVALIAALTPYQSAFEKKYPLIPSHAAPVRFTFLPRNHTESASDPNMGSDFLIPLNVDVSGIAPGSFIQLNGVIIRPDSPASGPAKPGWQNAWMSFWPEGGQFTLSYFVHRSDYDQWKTQKVRIELAATEYRETDPREISLDPAALSREGFGICRIPFHNTSFIQCRRPFTVPSAVLTFDQRKANCTPDQNEQSSPSNGLSHDVNLPTLRQENPFLNPILDYNLGFQPKPIIQSTTPGQTPPAQPTPRLCLGAPLLLAKPQLQRQFRIQLDLPNTRLQDLVESIQSRPAGAATSIVLRP